jgi:hypothetical protein
MNHLKRPPEPVARDRIYVRRVRDKYLACTHWIEEGIQRESALCRAVGTARPYWSDGTQPFHLMEHASNDEAVETIDRYCASVH